MGPCGRSDVSGNDFCFNDGFGGLRTFEDMALNGIITIIHQKVTFHVTMGGKGSTWVNNPNRSLHCFWIFVAGLGPQRFSAARTDRDLSSCAQLLPEPSCWA